MRNALLAVALALAAGLASAQSYPDKPIRLVIPWPAGGITDSAGRIMAQRMSERMKTPVVVENRAGAAGTIGAETVARAPADGYTLLLASAETHAIAPNLRTKLPYDPQRDFVAIAPFAINPFSIVSRPDFPAKNVKELVAMAKSQPGKFTYSSAGLGSTSQMAMETFKGLAGADILHVPFAGTGAGAHVAARRPDRPADASVSFCGACAQGSQQVARSSPSLRPHATSTWRSFRR